MSSFIIQFTSSALKDLRKIPKLYSGQVAKDIDALSKNPRPFGHKKLRGNEGLYRIRSGSYRVVYQIQDKVLVVLVVCIGDRKDVYRNF
jgi:mRNA interferase RelE/StbE